MRVIVDVDDTLLPLIETCLSIYNREYDDHVSIAQVTDWGVGNFTKIGSKFYDYFEDRTIYNQIQPYDHALEGIQTIRNMAKDIQIIYATHATMGAAGKKLLWLKEHGFWNEGDHYIETKSKHLIRADFMIDDNYTNIQAFEGDLALMFNQPWNMKYVYPYRVNNWAEFIKKGQLLGEGFKAVENYKNVTK